MLSSCPILLRTSFVCCNTYIRLILRIYYSSLLVLQHFDALISLEIYKLFFSNHCATRYLIRGYISPIRFIHMIFQWWNWEGHFPSVLTVAMNKHIYRLIYQVSWSSDQLYECLAAVVVVFWSSHSSSIIAWNLE